MSLIMAGIRNIFLYFFEKRWEKCQGFVIRSDGSTLVINMENANLVEIDPSNGSVISDISYTYPLGIDAKTLAVGPDDNIYAVLKGTKDINYEFFAKLNEVSGAWETIGKVPAFQATPSGFIKVWGMCFGPPFNEKVLYLASSSFVDGENPNTYWACLL